MEREIYIYIWVCLKIEKTPKPNGFADHYPVFKWLFHWEYTLFSDKPIYIYMISTYEQQLLGKFYSHDISG